MADIRVLLVDPQTLTRAGLRMLIESKPGIQAVGEARNLTEALEVAARTQPDVILFEPGLDNNGADSVPQFFAVAKHARVILVTGNPDARDHYHAVQAGAIGVVLKDQSPEVLRKAIEKVHAGEAWLDRSTIANVLTKITRPSLMPNLEAQKIALLSDRERAVITLMGKGLKNKQIAETMSISEVTVRHHLTSIFSKLDISDRLELVIYAYRNKLAELP